MFKRKHLFANHVRTSNEKCNNISKTVIKKLKKFSLRGKDFICIHSPIQRNKCYNSSWRNIPRFDIWWSPTPNTTCAKTKGYCYRFSFCCEQLL